MALLGTETIVAPLVLHEATVRPEWVDYNGHLSEAYYVFVFGHASDALYDFIGMDAAHRERTRTSVYTLEAHIGYLREVAEGSRLRVTTQVIGVDTKRMHIFHAMDDGEGGALLATEELMLLHVDMRGPRAAPFPPEIAARLEAILAAHAGLAPPRQASRRIALPR
ncbi:MAG: thioesterase family protein [Alphaproteobacteria bacterium]